MRKMKEAKDAKLGLLGILGMIMFALLPVPLSMHCTSNNPAVHRGLCVTC